VNFARAKMGAVISRLQFTADNLANVSAKAQESRSRIEDTDYSQATTELAKRNIIQQAAQAMLAQANQQPQTVLQLLK
jgi:flagellin